MSPQSDAGCRLRTTEKGERINEQQGTALKGEARPTSSRRGFIAAMVAGGLGVWIAPDLAAQDVSDDGARRDGERIAKLARKYKGTRYVYAGNTPKGFDCSGFTQYVVKKVTGRDMGQTVKGQWGFGDKVSSRKLRAGDLVFFENTFDRGLSHVGIYLDNRKFIHAENEQTDVTISDLDSDYYRKHYAGARRIV